MSERQGEEEREGGSLRCERTPPPEPPRQAGTKEPASMHEEFASAAGPDPTAPVGSGRDRGTRAAGRPLEAVAGLLAASSRMGEGVVGNQVRRRSRVLRASGRSCWSRLAGEAATEAAERLLARPSMPGVGGPMRADGARVGGAVTAGQDGPPAGSEARRLAYFPAPYPGEILYSVLARLSRHLGHPSQFSINEMLFDVRRRKRNILFSDKLGLLASKLPSDSPLTAERMLSEHTVFPYFAACMKPKRRVRAVAARTTANTTLPFMPFSPHGWKWMNGDKEPRFCPQCAVEMVKRHGEMYWRRDHQIRTVLVCPDHGCVLQRADLSKASKQGMCAAAPETCPVDAAPVAEALTEQERQTLKEIAVRSAALLDGSSTLAGVIDRGQLLARWAAKGLTLGTTRRNLRKLQAEVLQRFGHLRRVLPGPFDGSSSRGSGRFAHLAGQYGQVSDPIVYIMADILLSDLPALLLPFGHGPWPCPNPLAEHVSPTPVTNVVRSRLKKRTAVGRFSCPCGYVCIRTEKPDGTVSAPSVRVFGETLRPLLVSAIEGRWTLRRTAEAAGIKPRQLAVQAKAMDLECPGVRRRSGPRKAGTKRRRRRWSEEKVCTEALTLSSVAELRVYDLTDEQWGRIEALLPTKPVRGPPYKAHRQILDGILWVLRTGSPWSYIPRRYGTRRTVVQRFRTWREDGTWDRIEAAL